MSQPAYQNNLPPEERRSLLARLLREKAKQPKSYPVSFGQQRLWFIDQLEPGSSAYNMPAALRLKGALNAQALELSLNEVVRRHAVLRTTIANVDGEPMQMVHPSLKLKLKVDDLSALTEKELERRSAEILLTEIQRPFNLNDGPLLRASLIRLSGDEHIILVNLHHIVTDAWSNEILIEEVVTFYEMAIGGKLPPLPELPIQYADYAKWQRTWMEGEEFAAELQYWRRQLGGHLAKLELPGDYPRPSAQDYSGARHLAIVDKNVAEALAVLSRREGVTLFMTLLAAFKTLLHRYTGQEDVVLGTAVSGRNQAETEKLIGFFVNTLVLRSDLSGRPTFLEVLRRVKEVSLAAFANQSVPFEKLVEELKPERNRGRNPLFEIMFNFGNLSRRTVGLNELSLSFVELAEPQARHAITLYADESVDQIILSVVYQRALFTAERMQGLLSQYTYLLSQIVETPDKLIDSYSLRTPATLHLLPDPKEPLVLLPFEPVTEAFKRWVDRTPDKIAMSHCGVEFTYRQLYDHAMDISGQLIAKGLQAGDTVAVIGPRSFSLISSILAILQTSGVLLLIDRTYPELRINQLLIEGRARQVVLICDDNTGEAEFGARAALPLTRLRASDGEILDPVPARPELQLFQPKPESPAYISFTSGSTGTPKAILCNHNGLSHFITWERDEFHVTPADRVAQLSRLSFDVAMRDIFLPLTSGAVLCVPPDQTQFDTDQVLEWLEAEAVSIIHIVPAVAQASLTRLSPDVTLKHLRWTLFAGEALPAHLVQRWREAFPLAGEIANLYGPTETTLAKFYYHVPRAVCPGTQPVGRPLPHTQGLVVNRSAQLCGIGEPGEIVIRTPYRSLGYINASREQSDRFVVNPYRNDADDILYYTGDRGRYRADGQLEIQGRMDHQVKIGGVRIELGEVESVLGKHPDVSECVAAVKGDSPDNQRLVAYVVPKPGATPSISSLRELIKRELPKYQHPSHFIILEKLELLPNGKVDRNLLPDPGTGRPATEDAYVAPRDEVELKLSHIWEDVLKISPVGVTDNFFDLGGHSLLAVRLMAQIHKAFDVWLPLSSLFDEATVEMLALRLRRPHTGSHDPLVAIQPQGHRLPLFFVHAAGGNVLCYSDLAKHLGQDQPFYGLQSFGFEEGTEPLNRIEDMAACYVAAIVKAQAEGPYLLGGWSMGGIVAYEMAQQLVRSGQQVALLALLDHSPPEPGDIDEGLDEISLMQRFFDGRVEIDPESLEAMSGDQRLAYFLQQAMSLKLVPPDLGISQIKSYLKVYRANVRALRSYSAEPYAGRITLLRTKYEIAGADDTLGWGALAAQGVDVFEVPGKHSDMMTEPHLNILAQYLKACLDKVQSAR